MSRPFSRIMEDQEWGAGSHISGNGVAQDGESVGGNGIGNGVGTGAGAGVRSWWRNSIGETRRSNDEITPKPSSQENEMAIVTSNFAGLSPVIAHGLCTTPIMASFSSTRAGSDPTTYSPQPQQARQNLQPLERPQPTVLRHEALGTSNPVIQVAPQASHTPGEIEIQQTSTTQTGKWWKGGSLKVLQSKLITVLVAGGFLAVTLATYLGLALTNDLRLRHEWHVLLILIILIATMFFCHALVRLCILATNPGRLQRGASRNFSRVPSVPGPDGYANPREPIRVHTSFDHDVEGVERDLTKLPPPVYGLWRCSVRVNPNQFYWVRRTSVQQSVIPEGREPTSPNGRNTTRPPSYISEDGVSYASAVGNAVSPARLDPPLPPHPSEVRWLQTHR